MLLPVVSGDAAPAPVRLGGALGSDMIAAHRLAPPFSPLLTRIGNYAPLSLELPTPKMLFLSHGPPSPPATILDGF
jgi:hypothetical protein